MRAARAPRADKAAVRLLGVHAADPPAFEDRSIEDLPELLQPRDLLVVNDAATLPASLHGVLRHRGGTDLVELRLMSQLDERTWRAVVMGAGNWRTPTEARPAPPQCAEGDEIVIAPDFVARVSRRNDLSEQLLELEFDVSGEALWRNLYRYGKPVQYSYLHDELKLWSVQNVYSSRPWAVEMPSAGHALSWRVLLALLRKGVAIAPLTHGAGLSSTGDAHIDGALPLVEAFEIPASTLDAVAHTRKHGGRIVAAGTSVVRALESSSRGSCGFTDLRLGAGVEREIVDGLLTGTHETSESHYDLLRAFLPDPVLVAMSRHLETHDYLTHEFGDLCLVFASPAQPPTGHRQKRHARMGRAPRPRAVRQATGSAQQRNPLVSRSVRFSRRGVGEMRSAG